MVKTCVAYSITFFKHMNLRGGALQPPPRAEDLEIKKKKCLKNIYNR